MDNTNTQNQTPAVRNKNLGNLKDPNTGQFRTFSSDVEGKSALYNDLTAKMTGTSRTGLNGNSSLLEFSKIYAPASDKNDPVQYAANLANKLGVSPDTPIGTLLPRIDDFASAIASNEDPSHKYTQHQQIQTSNLPTYNPKPFSQPTAGIADYSGVAETEEQPKSFGGKALEFGKDVLGGATESMSQLGGTLLAKLYGEDVARKMGIVNNQIPGLTGKKVDVLGYRGGKKLSAKETAEQTAGNILENASWFVPGKGVLGATGMGALMGAGSAMREGQNLSGVASQAAQGGITGGVFAGLTKGLGKGIEFVGDVMSGKQGEKATQELHKTYSDVLNLSTAQQKYEKKTGKDIANTLMKNKAPLGKYADNTLDATPAITILQPKLSELNTKAQEILKKPQGVVYNTDAQDILKATTDRINGLKIPSEEKEVMIKKLKKSLQATVKEHGLSFDPATTDLIKQGYQNSVFKKSLGTSADLSRSVNYLISDEFKKATEKAVAGTDAGDVLRALNLERSELIDTISRLTELDGIAKIKGGNTGFIAGGVKGALAGLGANLGVPGVLAGDYFGTKAMEYLTNPATKIAGSQAKANVLNKTSGLLGGNVGKAGQKISATGRFIQKTPRVVGAIATSSTKSSPK